MGSLGKQRLPTPFTWLGDDKDEKNDQKAIFAFVFILSTRILGKDV
jgi:hypothetical protein